MHEAQPAEPIELTALERARALLDGMAAMRDMVDWAHDNERPAEPYKERAAEMRASAAVYIALAQAEALVKIAEHLEVLATDPPIQTMQSPNYPY